MREVRRTWAALSGELPSELVLVAWTARVRLPSGETTQVSVDETAPLTPEQVRRAGERVVAFLPAEPELRLRVAREMLDDAAHWWDSREDAGEDDPPLTAETFLAKLRLESVGVEEDGDLTLFYDDAGEVFAGHVIQVRLGADLELIDMVLAG